MPSTTRELPGEPARGRGPSLDGRPGARRAGGVTAQEPAHHHRPGGAAARTYRLSLRQHLVVGDVLALGAAWAGEALLAPSGNREHEAAGVVLALSVTLLAMHHSGLYRSRVCALRSLEALKVLWSVVVGTAVLCLFRWDTGQLRLAGPMTAAAVAVVAVLVMRWRYTHWLKARRSTSRHLRRVVLIGTNADAEDLWSLFNDEPALGYEIGAVVGEQPARAPWRSLPCFPALDHLGEVAGIVGANGAVVVASSFDPGTRRELVNRALDAGLHVQVWPGLNGFSTRRAHLAPVSDIPMFYVERREVARAQLAAKRLLDLVVASVVGLVSLPLVGLAALAVKLEDRGPVLHHSERVGRGGQVISVLKLRTMVPDASSRLEAVAALNERRDGPLFKATHDPRVTRVGRFLRATSIDELPQLWNVLNGTMSLVGPRPALVHEVERFDEDLHRRHEMRPGITGLWQVEARDNPSFSAYRRLDLSYVDNWAFSLDLAILASTAYQLLGRALAELARAAHLRRPGPEGSGLAMNLTEAVIDLDHPQG